jgi:hypothetical protein
MPVQKSSIVKNKYKLKIITWSFFPQHKAKKTSSILL